MMSTPSSMPFEQSGSRPSESSGALGGSGPSGRSDPELIAAARRGDTGAYDELFRRHEPAIRRLAVLVAAHSGEVEDLILRAYAAVLQALDAGDGPRVAFRTFALVTLLSAPPTGTAGRGSWNAPVAAYGYEAMPEEWQAALWHAEVEREPSTVIGGLLGLPAAEVDELTRRARGAIRRYAATSYLAGAESPLCRAVVEHLAFSADDPEARSVRDDGAPDRRRAAQQKAHLDRCERCATIRLRLAALDERLGLVLARALLRDHAAGYLATAGNESDRVPAHQRLYRMIAGSSRNIAAAAVIGALTLALAGWGLLSATGTTGSVSRTDENAAETLDGYEETADVAVTSQATSARPAFRPAPPAGPLGHSLHRRTGRTDVVVLPAEPATTSAPSWLSPDDQDAEVSSAPPSAIPPGSTSSARLVAPPVPPTPAPGRIREHRPRSGDQGPTSVPAPPATEETAPGTVAPPAADGLENLTPSERWRSLPPGMSTSTTSTVERTRTINPEQSNVEQVPTETGRQVSPWAPLQWYRRAMPWNWLGGGAARGAAAPAGRAGGSGAPRTDDQGDGPLGGGLAAGGGVAPPARTATGPDTAAGDGLAVDASRREELPAGRRSHALRHGPGLVFGRHFSGYRY